MIFGSNGFEPKGCFFADTKVRICVVCFFSVLSIPCDTLAFIGPRKKQCFASYFNCSVSLNHTQTFEPFAAVVDAKVILRSFRNLSEQAIYDLIQKSAKKSRVLDPLPPTLVCDSLDFLLPVITKLVNTSQTTAHSPTEWKQRLSTRN